MIDQAKKILQAKHRGPLKAPGRAGLKIVEIDEEQFLPCLAAARFLHSKKSVVLNQCRARGLELDGRPLCVFAALDTHAYFISKKDVTILAERRFVDVRTRVAVPAASITRHQAERGEHGYLPIKDAALLFAIPRTTLHMRLVNLDPDIRPPPVLWDQLMRRQLVSTKFLTRWRHVKYMRQWILAP